MCRVGTLIEAVRPRRLALARRIHRATRVSPRSAFTPMRRTDPISNTPSEELRHTPPLQRRRDRGTPDRSVGLSEDGGAADHAREIAPEGASGGANTSHTIVVAALDSLLDAVPPDASHEDYRVAVLEANVLGKKTNGARARTFRYLKELYLLRPDSLLFRALRDLWAIDPNGRPLLAGLCALARDAVFRASSGAILACPAGRHPDLGRPRGRRRCRVPRQLRRQHAGQDRPQHVLVVGADRAPRARRTTTKIRTRAVCRPADVAYALLLGHLQGVRGQRLFETLWARSLDQPTSHLVDLAAAASQHGMIEFRRGGGVVEVGFRRAAAPLRPRPAGDGVSYVDELLDAYRRFVALPWQQNLAPPQRVWMAVYPPEHERRLRLHLPAFKAATNEHAPLLGARSTSRRRSRRWMADHEYRDDYFEDPELLETALPAFFEHLVDERASRSLQTTPILTASWRSSARATLFGLGDAVKVSALLNAVNDAIAGRLLVFFPASTRATATGCSTRATAGTTSRFRSRRTGAVDDDHEPRALLPRSDRDEDPERRCRQGRPAGDRAAVGRAALGAAAASCATASTPAVSSGSSTASSPTSARRSSRRCG